MICKLNACNLFSFLHDIADYHSLALQCPHWHWNTDNAVLCLSWDGTGSIGHSYHYNLTV